MQSTFPFYIYSPGGNITALVETEGELDFSGVANEIIKNNPKVEQVGFVMPSQQDGCDFHVQMMGGEFCGNAARCAAMFWGAKNSKVSARFTVSGFFHPLMAAIENNTVTLNIPRGFLKSFKPVTGGWLADFNGIRFVVVNKEISKSEVEELVNKYRENIPAVGVVILETTQEQYLITPWVWVGSTNTFIKETACASGSIATMLVLQEQGINLPSYSILQPSGSVLSVNTIPESLDFVLSGEVNRII